MNRKVADTEPSGRSRCMDQSSSDPVNAAVQLKWTELAGKRLQELRSGKVKAVPGDEVFSEVVKQLAK